VKSFPSLGGRKRPPRAVVETAGPRLVAKKSKGLPAARGPPAQDPPVRTRASPTEAGWALPPLRLEARKLFTSACLGRRFWEAACARSGKKKQKRAIGKP